MAKSYRFFNEALTVDAEYFTDGTANHEQFFLTEKRFEDSADIRAGLNLEIQPYTETELKTLAQDEALSLTIYDNGSEVETIDGDASFLTYSMAEQTDAATIDQEFKTIDIEVANGTTVTALVATFTLSTGASAAVDATPQVSETTDNDFTNPVVYTVTSDLGTDVDWTVTVTVAEA